MDLLFNFLKVTALAGVGAVLLILVLTPFADRLRLIDRPDLRKNHASPVPMVGGLAIYLILLAGFVLVAPPLKAGWFMFSVTLLVIIGLLDDADAGTDSWIVWTTGTAAEWFYVKGTLAV